MASADMYAIARDDASAAWFDAAAEGRLLIRSCSCGQLSAPQTTTCPACGSTALSWTEAARRGVVASYALVHRRDAEPLPVAIIELDEGPWMRMQVQDADDIADAGTAADADTGVGAHTGAGAAASTLTVGQPVEIGFARPDGGEPIPFAYPS